MSDEIKIEVIKKTQNSLGKYVKKPPLTEKLLRKPPFRFLHDIINAIIKETGFLEDLFSEEELNSEFKDKEAKIAYLTKLVNVVKLVTGIELTVRPVKIVSGQEPTKTNQLLQAIANALDKNISSAEAVKHYKTSVKKKAGKSTQPVSPERDQLKTADGKSTGHGRKVTEQQEKDHKSTRAAHASVATRKQSENHEKVVKNKDGHSTGKLQSTKRTKTTNESTASSKISSNFSSAEKSENRKISAVETKQPPKVDIEHVQAELGGSRIQLNTSETILPMIEVDSEHTNNPVEGEGDSTVDVSLQETENNAEPESINKTPGTGKSASLLQDAKVPRSEAETVTPSVSEPPVSMPKHTLRPPSGRPSSARPAAPKLRWKPEFSVKSNEFVFMENESVILDSFDAQDNDKEDMVVVETDTHERSATSGVKENITTDMNQEHGYLVAQILETQRELAKNITSNNTPSRTDKEIDVSSLKVKEATAQDVDTLRGKIQTLTMTTNPLGNLLDFWQEDVELMQKELSEWRAQYEELHNQLMIEKTSSHTWAKQREESLSEIQAAINDQHEQIYHKKLSIIKSSLKMQQLLDGRA